MFQALKSSDFGLYLPLSSEICLLLVALYKTGWRDKVNVTPSPNFGFSLFPQGVQIYFISARPGLQLGTLAFAFSRRIISAAGTDFLHDSTLMHHC